MTTVDVLKGVQNYISITDVENSEEDITFDNSAAENFQNVSFETWKHGKYKKIFYNM